MRGMFGGNGFLSALLVAFVGLAGCVGAGEGCFGAQGYDGQSGVCNETDSFSYGEQTNMKRGDQDFAWQNTQGEAQVSWGAPGGLRSVAVTFLDADGDPVYEDTLNGPGQKGDSRSTGPGEPGEWTIRIAFSAFTGQMGIGVQAA